MGVYSLAARHEWVKNRERLSDKQYQRYVEHFDPDLYDPVEWARIVRQAGMRYAIITTKHHDGFCLWDSQLTDYKAPNTPAGRDLLRPWVEAFRAEGLKVGFYHSLIDWHHPEFPLDNFHPQHGDLVYRERERQRDISKYAAYLHGQVRELITNYGQIDTLWFDFSYAHLQWGWAHGKGKDDWQSEALLAMVHKLMPNILVNNRADFDADFVTPEDIQPRGWATIDGKRVPWEVCQTANGSWGYTREALVSRPPDLLVRLLIDAVSKGGNMMLNAGPTARGVLDPTTVHSFEEVGTWLRLHGRAIYSASASAFTAPEQCCLTQRGNRLYLHVFSWPLKHICLENLADRVEYAQLLNDASEIQIHTEWNPGEHMALRDLKPGTLILELPLQRPDVLVPVIELFLKEE